MNCPNCKNIPLVMSERQGVEIDYCPQCRGVWLDRGELDKIIERTAQESEPSSHRPEMGYRDQSHSHHNKQHKKKHWLNELFD